MARAFDVETVDPWAQLTAPPVDETPEQRRIRERREEAERKISEEIDEALKLEREEMRAKRRNRLKVLLLGQSESGKWKPKIFHLSLSFDCMKGRTGHHFFRFICPTSSFRLSHAVAVFRFPSARLLLLVAEFPICRLVSFPPPEKFPGFPRSPAADRT